MPENICLKKMNVEHVTKKMSYRQTKGNYEKFEIVLNSGKQVFDLSQGF